MINATALLAAGVSPEDVSRLLEADAAQLVSAEQTSAAASAEDIADAAAPAKTAEGEARGEFIDVIVTSMIIPKKKAAEDSAPFVRVEGLVAGKRVIGSLSLSMTPVGSKMDDPKECTSPYAGRPTAEKALDILAEVGVSLGDLPLKDLPTEGDEVTLLRGVVDPKNASHIETFAAPAKHDAEAATEAASIEAMVAKEKASREADSDED